MDLHELVLSIGLPPFGIGTTMSIFHSDGEKPHSQQEIKQSEDRFNICRR